MLSCSGEILHGAVYFHGLLAHRNGGAYTQIGNTQEMGVILDVPRRPKEGLWQEAGGIKERRFKCFPLLANSWTSVVNCGDSPIDTDPLPSR